MPRLWGTEGLIQRAANILGCVSGLIFILAVIAEGFALVTVVVDYGWWDSPTANARILRTIEPEREVGVLDRWRYPDRAFVEYTSEDRETRRARVGIGSDGLDRYVEGDELEIHYDRVDRSDAVSVEELEWRYETFFLKGSFVALGLLIAAIVMFRCATKIEECVVAREKAEIEDEAAWKEKEARHRA